jgi:hypothetical protein
MSHLTRYKGRSMLHPQDYRIGAAVPDSRPCSPLGLSGSSRACATGRSGILSYGPVLEHLGWFLMGAGIGGLAAAFVYSWG